MNKVYGLWLSARNLLLGALMTMVLVPNNSFAQIYVQIGNGTATNTSTGNPCPLGNYYEGQREQYIILASELQAAGAAGGIINEIAWEVTALNGMTTGGLQNFAITLQHTTTSAFSTSWIPITNTANYTGTPSVSTGWNTYAFQNNFQWDGTSNILVQVCHGVTAPWTNNPSIKYHTTTGTLTQYERRDNTPGMCTISTVNFSSPSSNRPNTRFGFLPPVADDAGVEMITEPALTNCTLGNMSVSAMLNNFGSDTMRTCTVNWSINSSIQTPVAFTGLVTPLGGTSDTVSLGTANISDGDTLCIWTTDPNSVQDSFPNNDTICRVIVEALGGTYAIGSSTSADYPTFNAAVEDLMARGVCAPTTFNAEAGTFTEKVVIPEIIGASMTNWVTFMGDPLVTEISGTPNSDSNFVVGVEGNYIRLENITIDGTNGTSYAGVLSIDGAEYVHVDDCILNGTIQTGSWSNTDAVTLWITGSEMVTMENCEINGGGYAGMQADNNDGLYMMNNEFIDAYYYAMYNQNNENVTFNYNEISSSSVEIYNTGVYWYQIDGDVEIVGNNVNWGNYYEAWYSYGLNGSVDSKPLFANNMIRGGDGNGGTYGAYIYAGFADIVHNTIGTDASANSAYRALYVAGGANSVMNNMIYDTAGQSSTFTAALYYGGTYAVVESDYNNIYTNRQLGYLGSVSNTLSDWQTATGFDMNSTTLDPMFTSFDTMRTCNDSLDNTGTPIERVTDDFDGDGRNASAPDVGADEWIGSTPGSYSAGDDAIVCAGKSAIIGLEVTGGTFTWVEASNTGNVLGTDATYETSDAGVYIASMTAECGGAHIDTVMVEDVTPTATFTSTISFRTGSFMNTSANGNDYRWTVSNGDTIWATDLTYVFPDNGPYTVMLTTYNDCDTVDSDVYTWFSPVGINETNLANAISMRPNPVSDVLTIEFAGFDANNMTIEMTNIQGQMVYNNRIVNSTGRHNIDVSSLDKGMYLLRFVTEDDITTKRVIVK